MVQHSTPLHSTPFHSAPLHRLQLQLAATTLLYTIPRKTTLHYPTLHCTTFIIPPQIRLQLHYVNYTTPQLQLHDTTITITTTVALRRSTPNSGGFGGYCNHSNHSQKKPFQPPFRQSVASLCHPRFTTSNLSYRFLIFEISATALCSTTSGLVMKT